MAVVQRFDQNIRPNGRCFICGRAAVVDPDRDDATGYGCGDCGRYDLVEKDRAPIEAWMAGAGRRARLHMAVKYRWFTCRPLRAAVSASTTAQP